MLRGYLIVLILAWLPISAYAQQPIVRSGEHEGYSRLVAPLPDAREWKITHIGQVVTFTVSGYEQGYDLSDIFRYIPRDRVRTIKPQPNGFVVNMGCDCRVATFIDRERFVVLDFTSPGVKRSMPFSPVLPVPSAVSPEQNMMAKTASEDVTLPLVPTDPPSRIKPAELPVLARPPLSEIEQESLTEIQHRLARELGTATTQGLLTPVPGRSLPVVRRAQVNLSDIASPEVTEPASQAEIVNDVINNMRVTSSMDIPGVALKASKPRSLSGINCPTDSLEVASWADGRPFHQQAGDLRKDLFQEFDKLNGDASLKLAKLYIHFGFGAEARQVLRLDPKLAGTNRMLADIAEIMETGAAPPDSMLHSMLGCETDVALWAILARRDINSALNIDSRPALLSLNKLPAHLRSFIAPALSQRFLAHGDGDAAATALRSLERLPAKLPSSAKLAKANIALDEGDLEEASEGLSDVIDDNAEQSPEALIALVETRIEANEPISTETASLLEAYAKELKQTEFGPGLMRAHVLALVRSGQFDTAFAASKELGSMTDEAEADSLRARLLDELTASADDVVFLEHVFEQSPHDVSQLPANQKLALATRTFELGFAQQAQSIISDLPNRPRNEVRQLLAAKIALALSQPMRAQAELLEMTGEEVDLMRAEAKQIAGAHAEASELYRSANNEDAATRAAWLAGDVEGSALSEDRVFGPVLALSDAEVAASRQTNGMLARSEAALKESSAARQTLLDLLQAPALDIGTVDENK
jgi:hypothetical protein